ncbi:MAG: hypothetical protein PWQ17_2335 [Anaerophaga sp.]|uniref:hypothetical protein n=1 Tax=Anaerophaga thermohalophila TaxID=177400 RepID=UPI000237D5E3|nr:hypothetical protein [Anaerophaga thermohalophila]MDK2842829.1 hypothetical protein [Anaerophaga sp.]MDN5291565.1 hypothetical protein [Anaerophaga sp.]
MGRYRTIQQWYEILSSRLKGAPRESIRFYSLEAFPRLMHHLEANKSECALCAQHFEELDKMSFELGQWMKTDAPEMVKFQAELEESVRHLKTEHRVFPKGLWLSRFVLMGILVGILGALITVVVVAGVVIGGVLFTGAFIGMLIGWIAGKNKERKIKKQNRLY